MFELFKDEFNNLRSQILIPSWGGSRYLPFVFEAIKQLLEPPEKPKKKIGYTVKEKQKAYNESKFQRTDGLTLTPPARSIWEAIPGNVQLKLLNNVWCFNCRETTGIGGDVTGKVAKGMLVLHGKCTRCGLAVVRVIENE